LKQLVDQENKFVITEDGIEFKLCIVAPPKFAETFDRIIALVRRFVDTYQVGLNEHNRSVAEGRKEPCIPCGDKPND